MNARSGRVLGQILGWTVVVVAVLVAGVLAAPFIVLGLLVQAVARLVRMLSPRVEVDGSADGGEPDALTPELRDQIDGRRSGALTPAERIRRFLQDEIADDTDLLGCGCSRSEACSVVTCLYCDWRACYEDRLMHHDCPRDEAIRSWQNTPLPPAVAASVNDAFAAIIHRSNVSDLNGVDQQLSRYYLIGDEK